ncbi:hypothetical protein BN874_1780006 [Candidatus Contendobacter odensis Run_B_J11]|uniref:Uncharacterized protein n=1 Tax=Candidatus Contendobacter odensis Run_B_J11 TaxID=1400861 RepID=A0A7U7GAA2_9GAMM|nr:hypothetical protein BN874_1780006 [Candidatus Contendobacter odensis Run_B_J11]
MLRVCADAIEEDEKRWREVRSEGVKG